MIFPGLCPFLEFSITFWTSYHYVALAAWDTYLLTATWTLVDVIVSCLISIVSEVLEKTYYLVPDTDILLILFIPFRYFLGKKPIITIYDEEKSNKTYNSA